MDQNQSEFLVEIEELVEHVFKDLEELREPEADKQARRNLIDALFRHVHSIKGLASTVGLEVVSQIAHELENLLDAIRAGRVVIDEAALNTCESAADALSESLSLAASGVREPSRQELFDQLRNAARGNSGDTLGNRDAILEKLPSEIWQGLSEPEKQRLICIVEEASPLFLVSTSFNLTDFDAEFFRLREKLAEFGEVISTTPSVNEEKPDRINFRVLYASNQEVAELAASVADFPDLDFADLANRQSSADGDYARKPGTPGSVASLASFVRVDLEKLDRLISSTHALFRLTANALNQRSDRNAKPADDIRSSFLNVQNELINLRMVSIGPTLQRAARAGRTAARMEAKEVDFDVRGSDLRLDKLLVDAIADPLIHLVRNAVDHGIESSEERVRLGKNKRGTVRIEAVSEGSQSRVRVTDDGRGIDPNLISKAAASLGIVDAESTLDFERSVRLIFRPGFTTLAAASNVSGRGVGLDVVETAVEQVGGELRVSSKFSAGTTFEVRLPVTFGLLNSTVVVSDGHHYCIPANQVVTEPADGETRTRSSQSQEDESTTVALRALLGQSPNEESGSFITCAFSQDGATRENVGLDRVRLAVDAVEGTEEVLVRNLGRHAGRWYGVAGATELKDGSVALVLDLPRLLNTNRVS